MKETYKALYICIISLVLLIISTKYSNANQLANELYNKCIQLYNEYSSLLKNNASNSEIENALNRYKEALEQYKNALNQPEILADPIKNDLPNLGINPLNDESILDAINNTNSSVSNNIQNISNSLSSPTNATSNYKDGIVMASVLNVRNGPWGEIIGQLKEGSKIDIISKEGSWYKILYNGKEAFVHSGYIATDDSVATAYEGYVKPQTLKVYSSTDNGIIIGELKQGTAIEVLEKKGEWLSIKYNNKEAFVLASEISNKPITINTIKSYTTNRSPVFDNFYNSTFSLSNNYFNSDSFGGLIGGPVPPAKISSKFGPRNLFGHNFHYGVDISVPNGTPLRALADGKVISTSYDYGGGKTITIKYNNGMISSYAHCRDATICVGDTVKKGEIVGHTNNTGAYTTGPHLHFSLKDPNGNYIDPLKLSSIWY